MTVGTRLRALAQLVLLLFLVHPLLLIAQAHRTTSKRAVEGDIRESVIRHQMKNFNSEISFVEVDGRDPSDDFMKRFIDVPGIVEKVSSSVFDKERMVVVDKATGKVGTIFQTGRIRWRTKDSVAVEGGYYCSFLCAAGIQFKVKRKHGKWVVSGGHARWIS
jgi:hypothetical protein